MKANLALCLGDVSAARAEFARSPRGCAGFLRALRFPATPRRRAGLKVNWLDISVKLSGEWMRKWDYVDRM